MDDMFGLIWLLSTFEFAALFLSLALFISLQQLRRHLTGKSVCVIKEKQTKSLFQKSRLEQKNESVRRFHIRTKRFWRIKRFLPKMWSTIRIRSRIKTTFCNNSPTSNFWMFRLQQIVFAKIQFFGAYWSSSSGLGQKFQLPILW